jgi:transmembrane sensor
MTGEGKSPDYYQVEDFVTEESFINFFFDLNRQDKAFWENWIYSHPEKTRQFEAAKQMLRNLSFSIDEVERNEQLARLKKAIDGEGSSDPKRRPVIGKLLQWGPPEIRKRTGKRNFVGIALFFLLVLGLGGYVLLSHMALDPAQLTQRSNDSAKPVVITLSDGTVVTLAPGSVFRYPATFDGQERKVYLDGEAQFHVSKDAAHPFKVYQGNIVATVLGTIFNVKKQVGDSVLMVELIEGRLKVETTNGPGLPVQSIMLSPDERAMYNTRSKDLHKEIWKSQSDLLKTVKSLSFRQNNFEQIASQIKADFGITLINNSHKKEWRFTGVFTNATAKEIIDNICLVEGLTNQVNGDSIIVNSLR